jgi:hypothetical protein
MRRGFKLPLIVTATYTGGSGASALTFSYIGLRHPCKRRRISLPGIPSDRPRQLSSACSVSMICSNRERNRSCSPLSRRSRGRIKILRSSTRVAENHGFRFEGIPYLEFARKSMPKPHFRQIQSQEFTRFPLPIKRFGIFHGGRPKIPQIFGAYSD